MTASTRARRRSLTVAGIGGLLLLVIGGAAPAVRAADPASTPNRLEQPMVDLAVLPAASESATPQLLVLDAPDDRPRVARLEVLERGTVWTVVAGADIGLDDPALGERWLIGLTPTRYALIATRPEGRFELGRAMVVDLEVRAGPDGINIVEIGRHAFERAIEAAGAADVDGDGRSELLLHFRPRPVADRACDTSDLAVLDGTTLALERELSLPGPRLGAGVIGRWDARPGDDLLTYAAVNCPVGPDPGRLRLLVLRLADGAVVHDADLALPRDRLASFGPPLRLDLDGVAPDEAIVGTASGLSVVDPVHDWRATPIGSGAALPLVAGPDADTRFSGQRIAWLEIGGEGGLATARVRRVGKDRLAVEAGSALRGPDLDGPRRQSITDATRAAAARSAPAAAWIADALRPGCPDLVVPAAILPCGEHSLRPGAAWLATRPVAVMPIEGQRRLLVAAGLAWDPAAGLPQAPTPWSGGPAGWWRHGASVPFALSEVRARDLTYFRDFPIPRASVDPTTGSDSTTTLPGFTGTRLFVLVAALAEGAAGPEPGSGGSASTALHPSGATGETGRVGRVPVPAGLESGRDGSFVRMSLADVRLPDGTGAGRWAMHVVPINDWGEIGIPAVGVVSRDTIGPTLSLDVPDLSPVWPAEATLSGSAEPGSTVAVDGLAPLELDRHGRFTFDTTLAPWPQTIRVSATDVSGNRTVRDVSVIGGVDYRRLPWALLAALALLAAVVIRGLGMGGGASEPEARRPGRVAGSRWSTAVPDDGGGPVIEDLPPGGGLPRR